MVAWGRVEGSLGGWAGGGREKIKAWGRRLRD